MCSSLEQRIVLYDDIKRIDLVNVLNKEETFAPEAVYFAFPFKVGEGPSARFEIAGADMAPGTEQLPGTTLDWQTAQHWVEFSGKDARVVWSPVEAPLVQFGDINTGKWQQAFTPANAWVFSYAMNNYWMTNFKASQEGLVEFCYSLTSAPPAGAAGAGPRSDRVSSTRFGWEVHTALVAAWLPAGNKGRSRGLNGRPCPWTCLTSSSRRLAPEEAQVSSGPEKLPSADGPSSPVFRGPSVRPAVRDADGGLALRTCWGARLSTMTSGMGHG
jgi:hypothetical protein